MGICKDNYYYYYIGYYYILYCRCTLIIYKSENWTKLGHMQSTHLKNHLYYPYCHSLKNIFKDNLKTKGEFWIKDVFNDSGPKW